MGAFEDLRDRLAEHRGERETARTEALLARETALGLDRALQTARRGAADAADLVELEGRYAAAVASARTARSRLADLTDAGAALTGSMADFTDPTVAVARLSDRDPILLFPLRLETRFKPSPAGVPQLWVRVYPDTCLVDGFEESLTATEVANGTAFWAAVWRACGDEGLERSAWRELVAASGAGRAGWVVRTLVARNPADKPEPTDGVLPLILVSTGPQPPEVGDYWAAVWAAQGDPAATERAADDLEGALGADRAAVARAHPPTNLADPPPEQLTPAETTPVVTVLQLPDAVELGVRTTSWSSAPRVDLLPDRFVLLGYDAADGEPALVELGRPVPESLQAGPDPQAESDDQLKPAGDDLDQPDTLQIPEGLRWMFDFERALEVGMAFRVDLTAAQAAQGFARLLVLGVRVSEAAASGSAGLSRLLEHHLHSRAGLELLAQGTPTNDTEQGGAGYTWRDDPEASFGPFLEQQPQFVRVADPLARRDGQWLADALGVPDELVARIPSAGLGDRAEAHAMQIALWPATIGYLMDALLAPVFSDQAVAATRDFFTRHVTGRGPLPALRIGDQPYGIQPAVAFSRLGWFGARVPDAPDVPLDVLGRLATLIRQVEDDWRPLLGQVSRIGAGAADSHQELLDVLGLHPTSMDYYPLGADGLAHKTHELSFLDAELAQRLAEMFPPADPLTLLRRLGYDGEEVPDLLAKIYRASQKPLDGPVIDDVPLSESTPIRASAGGRNYIEWLADAAADSITAVQSEQGFDAGKRPTALLYLLLRHALQLSFRETAVDLLVSVGALEDAAVLRTEPAFVHVAAEPREADSAASTESRYGVLFDTQQLVTGEVGLTVGDYIARHVRDLEGSVLPEHLTALDLLATLPTARLERLFAEHVDTASYRLDAWRTGLVGWALEQVRAAPKAVGGVLTHGGVASTADRATGGGAGLHLGAYGWVEDLRPEGKVLTPVTLPPDLAADIDRHDTVPLTADATNLGLVHAPSINHATTAAVLRNAHVAHEGQLSVDLSSRRVTAALAILEGMRGGQSLGALLGYQLERHVHDHGPLTVRALVYPLRREYPLAANQILGTITSEGDAQESIAAMNVVDGRKLLLHLEASGADLYPFANPRLPRRTAAEEAAVTAAVHHVRDVNDAVADLVLAEGVHQAVLGNYDRSAGTLDAFAKGNAPPEPEVIRTPRSGTGLTLRTALHLPTTGPANPLPALPQTPLARAEPAVNRWVAARLPAPGDVAVRVGYTDRVTGTDRTLTVTQEDLGLHPADLLYRAEARADQSLSDLDERVVEHLHATRPVRLDRPVVIRHTERIPGAVTFFELEGLLRSLRRIVVGARPLRPGDLVRQGDARAGDQDATTLPRARLADARDTLRDTLAPTLTPLRAVVADPTVPIDAALAAYVATVGVFAGYRIPQAGTGFTFEWRADTYARVVALVAARVDAWDERLARHDQLLLDYAALPASTTDDARLQLLRTAEVLISATVGSGLTPATHLTSLAPKRTAFALERGALDELVTVPRATLAVLVADAVAVADVAAFDLEPLDFGAERQGIDRFRAELPARIDQLAAEVASRVAAADAALTAHDAAPSAARADLVRDGLRALLGEDLVVAPRFTLPTSAATELTKAWSHSTGGGLTRHLTDAPPAGSGRDFPEEDWLHGVARVRDALHHLENVVLLSAALPGATAPRLVPVQLPHEDGQPWLALELPADTVITSERLLYTAVHQGSFDPTQPLCGLLVDEWTEVIPAREQTTGVAFHHDRPNAEPPQAWLLALPATFDGSWSFDELVGAVTDTLDAAKLRALEPTHLDTTPYDALLPATHSAWTYPEISISHNLLRNASIYARLAEDD